MNTKVQIIFYSMYGHVYRLAEAVAQGAKEVTGVDAGIFQVPELVPDDILEQCAAFDQLALLVGAEKPAERWMRDRVRPDADARKAGELAALLEGEGLPEVGRHLRGPELVELGFTPCRRQLLQPRVQLVETGVRQEVGS